MEIVDAMKLKLETESAIQALLVDFSQKTLLEVNDIKIYGTGRINYKSPPNRYDLQIEVPFRVSIDE